MGESEEVCNVFPMHVILISLMEIHQVKNFQIRLHKMFLGKLKIYPMENFSLWIKD